jgi:hypothetical protein
MFRSIAFPVIVLSFAATGRAEVVDFQIISHEVSVDHAMQSATFTLEFNRAPDFAADAFQYEIDADTSSLDNSIGWSDIDTVIRGGEIAQGNGLPVRDREGDGGPNSGGWGPVRALLPFELDGTILTFSSGLTAIGDTDGRFRYRLFTAQDGALTGQSVTNVIPLPTALWSGVAMLGGLGILRALRRDAAAE